jgi:hypothetical protein
MLIRGAHEMTKATIGGRDFWIDGRSLRMSAVNHGGGVVACNMRLCPQRNLRLILTCVHDTRQKRCRRCVIATGTELLLTYGHRAWESEGHVDCTPDAKRVKR